MSSKTTETGVNASAAGREVLPPEYYIEDAIDYDDYGIEEEEEGPYMTKEEKLERLREFDKQVEEKDYCPWRLDEVYPAPPAEITTRAELQRWEDEQYKRIDEARKKKKELKDRLALEKHLSEATKATKQ